jgi:hypothetical protein
MIFLRYSVALVKQASKDTRTKSHDSNPNQMPGLR